MRIGDIVVMKVAGPETLYGEGSAFWKKGDRAKLYYKDSSGDWWADFSLNDECIDDGQWCIGRNPLDFELISNADLPN
jgi:hypothetical protein